jgi:hypothetical protein
MRRDGDFQGVKHAKHKQNELGMLNADVDLPSFSKKGLGKPDRNGYKVAQISLSVLF